MHRGTSTVTLAICLTALGGCLYANVTSPLSYRSPTPADVSGTLAEPVEGEACSHALLGLFAWGNGGYGAAVLDAKAKSGTALLADLQADRRVKNVLGIYAKRCTHIRAFAVR